VWVKAGTTVKEVNAKRSAAQERKKDKRIHSTYATDIINNSKVLFSNHCVTFELFIISVEINLKIITNPGIF
jgi:hypothetical protein